MRHRTPHTRSIPTRTAAHAKSRCDFLIAGAT